MRLTRSIAVLTILSASLSLPLHAAAQPRAAGVPLDELPGASRWVVHIDVQRWLASPLGTRAVQLAETNPGIRERLRAFESFSSISVTSDVDSITLCGAGEREGVALLRGRWDAARLTELASGVVGSTRVRHGKHTILSWPSRRPGRADARQYGCIVSPGLAILGPDAQRVAEAVDVSEGVQPSLSGNPEFVRLDQQAGRAIAVAMVLDGQNIATNVTRAVLLHASRSILLTVGTVGDDLTARLDLTAVDEPAAAQVLSLFAGGQAMLSMRAMQDERFANLARALQVRSEGARVRGELTLPLDLLGSLLPTAGAPRAARQAP